MLSKMGSYYVIENVELLCYRKCGVTMLSKMWSYYVIENSPKRNFANFISLLKR